MGKKSRSDSNGAICNCVNCRNKRKAGGKGQAPNCLAPFTELEFGRVDDPGDPSAGKAAPVMGAGTVQTGDGGLLQLAARFTQAATIGTPSPGAGGPSPPRRPPQGGEQAPGRGNAHCPAPSTRSPDTEAAPPPPRAEDAMEVAPESPAQPPFGAEAGEVGRPGNATAAGATDDASADIDLNELFNYGQYHDDGEFYYFWEIPGDVVVETVYETSSIASLSDSRSPEWVTRKGRKKIVWPRKHGKKVWSPFRPEDFPPEYMPVDPFEETTEAGVEETKGDGNDSGPEEKKDDGEDGEAGAADTMEVDDAEDGYTADTEQYGGS